MKREMDKDIIEIVGKINDLGYMTVWSCSATSAEHPGQDVTMLKSRIAILCSNITNQQIEDLTNTAVECGMFT